MSNIINDATKIPLFTVLGTVGVLLPTVIVTTMWFTNLRNDADTSTMSNIKQDVQIKEINDKLDVVYQIQTDVKSIKTVLKIKEQVSNEVKNATQTNQFN